MEKSRVKKRSVKVSRRGARRCGDVTLTRCHDDKSVSWTRQFLMTVTAVVKKNRGNYSYKQPTRSHHPLRSLLYTDLVAERK